jgi:3-dehydrosphinganine reductase
MQSVFKKKKAIKAILKHVVITGGGSGLGFGLAMRYLMRGVSVSIFDLHITDSQQRELDNIAREHSSQCQFIKADVTQPEEIKEAVNVAIRRYGAPDLAINSAGVAMNKSFAETTPEAFKRVVDINLNGSFNFASAVLPTMLPGSRLVLIASVAGLISNYAYSAYGASKFGVVGLATTLRYEYEGQGIHITCVCPPEVKTPMVVKEYAEGNKVALELKKYAGSMQPDVACDQIIAGVDAGKWMVIPSFSGKAVVTFARICPWAFFALMKQLIKVSVKKVSKSGGGSTQT